jgi:regulator of sigma E protease
VRYSLNLIPFGAYVKMLGEEDPSAPGSFASKRKLVRSIVLAAGSGMNFLVAVLAFSVAYASGWPEPVAEIRIAEVAPASPAAQAGFQTGDIVVAVGGQPIKNSADLRGEIQKHLDQPVDITVARDGSQADLTVAPRSRPPEGEGALGVRLQDRTVALNPVPHGPIESIGFGFQRTFDMIGMTFTAPILALRGDVAPELVRPIGLPGMTQVAAQSARAAVESGWWFPVLLITGAFSAGLAVANMLPLPALDGGRLLFVAIEAVRGRRVSPEREGLIHLVGLVVLFSLMILISFNDLRSPLPSIDWGIR